ncbi:polysaccharide biosynthesis tyrosine autokinase [Serinibacter arcticus]|nr:polysaccharide biosynthesis tyrosine autokinase [Serinibacter arcticus]
MVLSDHLRIVRRRWMLIASMVLLGTLGAGVATSLVEPEYSSTAQVYVSVQTQDGSTSSLQQGSSFTQNQAAAFADLASSPLVLDPVVSALGLGVTPQSLSGRITATAKANTPLINVTARAADPVRAAELSNAVVASMTEVIPELQRPLDSAVSPVKLTITRSGQVPVVASSPDAVTNLAIGAFVGLAVGLGLAVLRSMLDTRIHGKEDLARLTRSPVLGVVGFDAGLRGGPLVMATDPHGRSAEAIRQVRTNLQFVNPDARPRQIVVTSAVPGEGKSTTAANLALALAEAGGRVLLIDADLRRPSIASMFGLEGAAGLTTLLIGQAEVDDVVQTWGTSSLDVITSGAIPPNPSELLGSGPMTDLLAKLAERYETVVLDAAPLLPVTDGAVLTKLTDGALFVVGAHEARQAQVTSALESLATVDGTVLGVVLNGADVRRSATYEYYDYTTEEQPAPRRPGILGRARAARAARADREAAADREAGAARASTATSSGPSPDAA